MNDKHLQNQTNQPSTKGQEQTISQQQCDEILLGIPAYSIGAVDAKDGAQIDERLAHCPEAMAELGAYSQIAERLLYSAPTAMPSAAVEQRLRAAIADADSSAAKADGAPNEENNHSQGEARESMSQIPFLRRRSAQRIASTRPGTMPRQPRSLPFAPKRSARRVPSASGKSSDRTVDHANRQQSALPTAMSMYQLDRVEPPATFTRTTPQKTQFPNASQSAKRVHPWHFGRFLATAAALALVFLNLALLNKNQQLQQEIQQLQQEQTTLLSNLDQHNQAIILLAAEEPQEIEIFAPDGESSAQADILWNNQLGIAVVYVRNFPKCDPGMKYQLWLTKNGERRSGGLFSVNSNGTGLLVVPLEGEFDQYDTIGITTEPDYGSLDPTSPPVVRGEL